MEHKLFCPIFVKQLAIMTTQQAQALVNARNEANKVLSAWGVTDPANLPKAAYKLWKIKQDAAVALYNKLK